MTVAGVLTAASAAGEAGPVVTPGPPGIAPEDGASLGDPRLDALFLGVPEAGQGEEGTDQERVEEVTTAGVLTAPSSLRWAGQDVFALAEIRCGAQADFLRGYWATVVTPGNGTGGEEAEMPELRLREHLAVLFNHGLLAEDGSADLTSAHWGDYWCIPKHAWCWSAVADTAFGGTASLGSVTAWEAAEIASLEGGFVSSFSALVEARCTNAAQAAPELPAPDLPAEVLPVTDAMPEPAASPPQPLPQEGTPPDPAAPAP